MVPVRPYAGDHPRLTSPRPISFADLPQHGDLADPHPPRRQVIGAHRLTPGRPSLLSLEKAPICEGLSERLTALSPALAYPGSFTGPFASHGKAGSRLGGKAHNTRSSNKSGENM